ncbi:RNA-binding protein [Fervidibacillus halotolerans]|uniref:RNA-binding protein n=1 Tax=Fervidibacillus halotolerans TaxID=2980027 RepID=A0A9E8S1M3_9BACI|nr:RNA-binding protein [Fervidibacillus halotolerans]WAA13667.1 RNA-binding protein [Fervidibacillus halotolerans]
MIDTVFNWCNYVETYYAPKLTDFLNPRQQFITKAVVGSNRGYHVSFFGGTEGCENKRALIYPDYFSPESDDFQISFFDISYPEKFVQLTHRQILGSLTGLGLKREKFGDIFISKGLARFFAAKEVGEYIRLNFHSVGKTQISIKELPLKEASPVQQEWLEMFVTASSLRLDGIIAKASKQSRQQVQRWISQGLVKVNWTLIDDPAFSVREDDLISVRGIGRLKIISVEGKTKRDKWRVTVGKLK